MRTRPVLDGKSLQSSFGLAPLNSALFGTDGEGGPICRDFYRDFCGPQLGLLQIGGVAISDEGRANRFALVLDSSSKMPGLQDVCGIAHAEGVLASVQLEHAGRQTSSHETGSELVAPSPVPCAVKGEVPRELACAEIGELVSRFVSSARLAISAGADIIEVHAAHGYLISSFLSSHSNRRSDRYGGSLSNRFRFLREIVRSIQDELGVKVGVRINVREQPAGGMTVPQVVEGLRPLRDSLAYISVSGGVYYPKDDLIMPRRDMGQSLWRAEAKEVRERLGLPVLIAGNISSVAQAEDLLDTGTADVVLFGRGLLADPKMLEKSGTGLQVRACTECTLCKYRTHNRDHVYCPLNETLRRTRRVKRPVRSNTEVR